MEDQFQFTPKKQAPGLTIKDLYYRYVRFLPFFVLSVALALLSAYLYLRYTDPTYQSGGSILVKEGQSGNGSGNSGDRFQQLFVLDNSININNEIELLKSKQLMERVVNRLNLNFNYTAKGKIRDSHLYSEVPFLVDVLKLNDSSAFTWHVVFQKDGRFQINNGELIAPGQVFENGQGKFRFIRKPAMIINNDFNEYIVDWKPTDVVASSYASVISVLPKGATGILLLSLESKHPKLAADVINALMQEYSVATIEDKNETRRQTIEFVDGRLKVISRELDSVTAVLLAYQHANNIIAPQIQTSGHFSRLESADQQINNARVQLNVMQILQDYLQDSKNKYNLVPSTLGVQDATLSNLISAYNVAQLDRKALIDANVPEINPRVQQLEDQIERLRQNVQENLRNIKNAQESAISRLQQQVATYNAEIQRIPAIEQNLQEIKRQLDTKQEVYNLLMAKREESAISLAATISNIKVLEKANPNPIPIKPNRRTIQLIALLAGLAIPALVIFLIEALNDKVTSRSDVEQITDATILGDVGHSFGKENLVVTPNNRGVVAEQFRIIRSNLQYVINHITKPVIMITSSFSGEGKSFISTNIGAVMALAGKRTIILEFDIRKPKVLSHLNLPKKPGLTNYLLGKIELEDLPVPVPGYDNLYVLPCGPVPPNPAEMLLDQKLAKLFDYLKREFDLVIMDTAPVGMVSDALTLSKFTDATLYIIRQGHTFKKQISLIDQFYKEGKLPKLSIILNDVKNRRGYGYGYGYGYGNGYGYGAGYFEEEEQPSPVLARWLGWMDMKKWNKKKQKEKV
jgi:capsular exopolysaccharide synthesis family protein